MHAHTRAFAHGALDGADGASGTLTGRVGAAEPCATNAVVTCRSHLSKSPVMGIVIVIVIGIVIGIVIAQSLSRDTRGRGSARRTAARRGRHDGVKGLCTTRARPSRARPLCPLAQPIGRGPMG